MNPGRASSISKVFLFSDTAYCKNPNKNQWYNFDDSSVSPVSQDRVIVSSLSKCILNVLLSYNSGMAAVKHWQLKCGIKFDLLSIVPFVC